MIVTTMGRLNVTTPGTPVPLSTIVTQKVAKIFFQVVPGLTGKAYIGAKGMNRTSLHAVIRILWPNTAGGISDSFFLESQDNSDVIDLSQYYIDMDVAGEGLLISYWTE